MTEPSLDAFRPASPHPDGPTLQERTWYATTTALCRDALTAVDPDSWDHPSSLPGWTVRELANHVVGGAHRYALILRGAPHDDLERSRAADHLGGDAVTAFLRLEGALATELDQPGAFTRVVRHRAGPTTGRTLFGLRMIEQVVHAWDLARSDDASLGLDPALCRYLRESQREAVEWLRSQGFYAPARETGPDADEQTLLLALTGRA